MINGMVNWAMFAKHDRTEQATMMFNTSQDRRLFVILLGDFLSEIRAFKGEPPPLGLLAAPSGASPSDLTFLFHLRQVCADPQFDGDTTGLRSAVEKLAAWLEKEFVAPGVNLNVIDVVVDLKITRFRYLKMCGDIAKHSIVRLATNVKHLRRLLAASGHEVTEQDAYRALEPFFDWFHDDILIFHASEIAELLNNIRLAMFEYLTKEYRRSWHQPDGADRLFYRYRIPENCSDPVAQGMYWDLMNRVRARPWVQRFRIDDVFRRRY